MAVGRFKALRLVLGRVWRPLRKLTRETEKLRVAQEAVAYELRLLRLHFVGQVEADGLPMEDPAEPATEVMFTTNAEQAALEHIAQRLFVAKGSPPSEDDVLQEFARQLESGHLNKRRMGSLGGSV